MNARKMLAIFMVLALLVPLFAVPVSAAPDVPGDVTAVVIAKPTTGSPVATFPGDTVEINYTTDGTGDGEVKIWLGGTTYLLAAFNVTLPVTAGKVNVTMPAGAIDGYWDLTVEAKNVAQSNWVSKTEKSSVIMDAVGAKALIQPNCGETISIATPYEIKWDPAEIHWAAPDLVGIKLELWVNGVFHSVIASGEANDGSYMWTPLGVVTTAAKVKLIAVHSTGATSIDESECPFTIFGVDITPPTVTLTVPPDVLTGWINTSPFTVKATAADPDSGIEFVEFYYSLNGTTWTLIGKDIATPYEMPWTISGIADGTKVWVKAMAQNGVGSSAEDVNPDPTNANAWLKVDLSKPAVTLDVPAEGAFVSGAVGLTLMATASDAHSKIASVQFQWSADGTTWNNIGAAVTVAPYSIWWSDPALNDATFWFRAVATNGAGLSANDANAVIVDSTPPTAAWLDLLAPDQLGTGLKIGMPYTIKWDAHGLADTNLLANPITLVLHQLPVGSATWTETVIASGLANTGSYPWTIAGVPGQSYVCVHVFDKAGNNIADCGAEFTMFAEDTTPPAVAITSPANGAWVKGLAVNVAASATDAESGILEVRFDKSQTAVAPFVWGWFATDSAAPYTAATTGVDGKLMLRATAKNGIGLETTSATVTVYLDNTAPTAQLVQPTDWDVISGAAYEFFAEGNDYGGSGVAKIVFQMTPYNNGCGATWTTMGTLTAEPWKLVWDSTKVANGYYCFGLIATDKVGWEGPRTVRYAEVLNSYSVNLVPGWQLISTPVLPYDTDIAKVMAGLPVKQVATFVWSGGKLVQQTWLPGVGGTLKTFKDGQGYWVEMNKAATLEVKGRILNAPPAPLPSYGVSAGWNLIGYTCNYNWGSGWDSAWADDYLGSVWTNTQALYGYDAMYDYYVETDWMQSGEGYWLAVTAPGTIYP